MVLLVVVAIGFVFRPLPQVGKAAADEARLPVWVAAGGAALPVKQTAADGSIDTESKSQTLVSKLFSNVSLRSLFSGLFGLPDCPGCYHHGEPVGHVQTVCRHSCAVEDQQN